MVTNRVIGDGKEDVNLKDLIWNTKKVHSHRRKISEIIVDFNWGKPREDQKLIRKLKNAVKKWSVALSLDPRIQ